MWLFCSVWSTYWNQKTLFFPQSSHVGPVAKMHFFKKIYKSLFYMLQIPGNSYQDVKVRVLFFFYPLSFSLRERKQKRNLSLHNGIPSFCLCSAGRSRVPLKWLLKFWLKPSCILNSYFISPNPPDQKGIMQYPTIKWSCVSDLFSQRTFYDKLKIQRMANSKGCVWFKQYLCLKSQNYKNWGINCLSLVELLHLTLGEMTSRTAAWPHLLSSSEAEVGWEPRLLVQVSALLPCPWHPPLHIMWTAKETLRGKFFQKGVQWGIMRSFIHSAIWQTLVGHLLSQDLF